MSSNNDNILVDEMSRVDSLQMANAQIDILTKQNRNLTLENDRYRKEVQKLKNQLILAALCNNNRDRNNRSNISDDNDTDMFTNVLQLQKGINRLFETLEHIIS